MRNQRAAKCATMLVVAASAASMVNPVRASLISLSQTNGYVQDFDSLTSSDKSKFVLPGWAIRQFGGGGSQVLPDDGTAPDNGKKGAGGIYSYGPVGGQDRALGTLTDAGGNFGIFGANFQNTGADLITRLNISYTGEEWRLGVEGHQNTLQFQYSLEAKSLSDSKATWLNVPALNFLTPNLTGVGAHDGTLAANQTQIASTISFLNIPQGGTFWIRWQEIGVAPGTDGDGLAVDNFSISAVPETSTILAGIGALCFLAIALLRPRLLTRPQN